ncbi:long-chain fatty acid transporter FAT1 [Sporobolomyces salmoneus]|uniref:long-chain fatty acid transporter FAT1 n=1 Tax=Sporobolomyces salmoneus TaxID=183962 RepID=UPI00316E89B8
MSTPALVAGGLAVGAYLNAKLGNDLRMASGLINARIGLASANRRDENSIYYYFDRAQKQRGDADCYVCDGVTLSFNQVAKEVNRLAHWLLAQGLGKGDSIALYMPNKPAYPIIWLACLSINVVPAFINFNLTGDGLIHCTNVTSPKLLLYESDLSSSISEISSQLLQKNPSIRFVRWADRFTKSIEKQPSIQAEVRLDETVLGQMSDKRIDDKYRKGITWQSPAVYIYTSGTTGLPKAATVTHGRTATAMRAWTKLNEFNKKTRIYTPMPLYHSTASLLAIAVSWNAQSCVIIGRKFSASTFWKDVRASNANVIQYVGEVLRFLLAVPPSPDDKNHNVFMAYGNGCRPEVWNAFRERFGVRVISEFFASSEGNGSLLNYNANNFGAGAVGREGFLVSAAQKNKQVIVKVDALTEEPFRDEKGHCVRADVNEPGELILFIDMTSPHLAFAGYYGNETGTNKKILKDVFKKGDAWFRTGDLLRRDKDGLYYFCDRLGDTFRWKSENVATTTVAEALGAVVDHPNVYGVLVPSHEGRAGCAAVPRAGAPIDFPKLSQHVAKTLPKYAQPLFIRIVDKSETNGTEKQLKVALRNQGVDPDVVQDEVWWLHPSKKEYVPFTRQDWEALKAGQHRL